MTKKKKDWFDTHVKVMTLDDNSEQEKKINAEIKKACVQNEKEKHECSKKEE